MVSVASIGVGNRAGKYLSCLVWIAGTILTSPTRRASMKNPAQWRG